MTAQISDTYRYNGRNHCLIAMTSPIDFNPEDYGFTPVPPHTACWSGYYCQYDISDQQLFLNKLWICNGENPYPVFEGKEPIMDTRERMMVYKDLHHPMDYTGSIVVGSGFLHDYYIHMGFQRAWAYRNVYELVLEHGKVVRKINHSKIVEGIRKKMKEDPEFAGMRGNIVNFIQESFSLDAKVKAWWI